MCQTACQNRSIQTFTLLLTIMLCWTALSWGQSINLAGQWGFQLDPKDEGLTARWYETNFTDQINLPGTLQAQGKGDKPSLQTRWTTGIGQGLLSLEKFQEFLQSPDNFWCPFWLTPDRHFVGAAWYRKTVEVPASWQGRRITLELERPHWQTTVWIDATLAGTQDSLGAAHVYDLSKLITPGQHQLTIRVDNRVTIPVGDDAHSVSDQTQSNWNGIAGRLELKCGNEAWLDNVQIYPDVKNKKITITGQYQSLTDQPCQGLLQAAAVSYNLPATHTAPPVQWPVEFSGASRQFTVEYDMTADCLLWDEFRPALYRLTLTLQNPDKTGILFRQDYSFGMRQLGVEGTQFTINGRKIFLRGTLECCIFPQTGHPPMEVSQWKRILQICRDHGLNHLRFHSWCPPQALFNAADEMGFYIQAEASCWAAFGDGSPLDKWIYEEGDRMIRDYGNHPSFILMAPSNEPGGSKKDDFLGQLIDSWEKKDPRRRYTAGSGWPAIPANDYHVTPSPRLQVYGPLKLDQPPQTVADYRQFISTQPIPVVSHEIGQWCMFPDITETGRYQGHLKARYLDIIREFLTRKHLLAQGKDFTIASGKFQALLYKQEIESALRTPGMGGFQLLDLHDFPGQGYAPVGVLDPLWESKGYITAAEYKRFCSETAPLARLKKFVWLNNETLQAQIDIANYGPADLSNQTIRWTLLDHAGQTLAGNTITKVAIPTGGITQAGTISVDLSSVKTAQQARLVVAIANSAFANDWPVWIYPVEPPTCTIGIHNVRQLDDSVIELLNTGQTVLLAPEKHTISGDTLGCFQPIFWNRITFATQTVHTAGILCDPSHPALQLFPTDSHSNWQWQDLLDSSQPVIMDDLPEEMLPIVQVIDDWNICRKLGVLFEARVGTGKLMICSMDILSNRESRPAANQLHNSLTAYMTSPLFEPKYELTIDQVKSFFREPSPMQKLNAAASASDFHTGYEPQLAIDGNPHTFWHSCWSPATPYPHHLIIDLNKPTELAGITCLPRQDQANGRIGKFELYLSLNGADWGQPAASGSWANDTALKTIRLKQPQTARYIKLQALLAANKQDFAGAAEIEIITQ